MLEEGKLIKVGRPPVVFYSLADQGYLILKDSGFSWSKTEKKLISENFLYITAVGEMYVGLEGFAKWCQERKFDVLDYAGKYVRTINKYEQLKEKGMIDATRKFKATFPDLQLSKVFYGDYYAMEIFGRTKIGQLMLYAKQSMDRKLIAQVVEAIRPAVETLIRMEKVDAVAFIPPTVRRQVQFIRELERMLDLQLPTIELVKVPTPVVVPQKTLSKLEDRVANARNTIMVTGNKAFKTVLLIDDAAGSGATLHEVGKKLVQAGNDKVIGFAVTGSLKGFEVLREV